MSMCQYKKIRQIDTIISPLKITLLSVYIDITHDIFINIGNFKIMFQKMHGQERSVAKEFPQLVQ
jgi:hypothetical protein